MGGQPDFLDRGGGRPGVTDSGMTGSDRAADVLTTNGTLIVDGSWSGIERLDRCGERRDRCQGYAEALLLGGGRERREFLTGGEDAAADARAGRYPPRRRWKRPAGWCRVIDAQAAATTCRR